MWLEPKPKELYYNAKKKLDKGIKYRKTSGLGSNCLATWGLTTIYIYI